MFLPILLTLADLLFFILFIPCTSTGIITQQKKHELHAFGNQCNITFRMSLKSTVLWCEKQPPKQPRQLHNTSVWLPRLRTRKKWQKLETMKPIILESALGWMFETQKKKGGHSDSFLLLSGHVVFLFFGFTFWNIRKKTGRPKLSEFQRKPPEICASNFLFSSSIASNFIGLTVGG